MLSMLIQQVGAVEQILEERGAIKWAQTMAVASRYSALPVDFAITLILLPRAQSKFVNAVPSPDNI